MSSTDKTASRPRSSQAQIVMAVSLFIGLPFLALQNVGKMSSIETTNQHLSALRDQVDKFAPSEKDQNEEETPEAQRAAPKNESEACIIAGEKLSAAIQEKKLKRAKLGNIWVDIQEACGIVLGKDGVYRLPN